MRIGNNYSGARFLFSQRKTKIHYCNIVSPEFENSYAACGRLVPNEQAYTEDGPAISCQGCQRVMRAQDARELDKREKS